MPFAAFLTSLSSQKKPRASPRAWLASRLFPIELSLPRVGQQLTNPSLVAMQQAYLLSSKAQRQRMVIGWAATVHSTAKILAAYHHPTDTLQQAFAATFWTRCHATSRNYPDVPLDKRNLQSHRLRGEQCLRPQKVNLLPHMLTDCTFMLSVSPGEDETTDTTYIICCSKI